MVAFGVRRGWGGLRLFAGGPEMIGRKRGKKEKRVEE